MNFLNTVMKNHLRILFFSLILLNTISFKSFAQKPEWLWAKSFGGQPIGSGARIEANSSVTDRDGNIYVTGTYFGAPIFGSQNQEWAYYNIFLVKYDPNGNVIWVRTAGDKELGSMDVGYSVSVDKDNNVYVTGTCKAPITFDTITLEEGRYFLVKYDKDGNVIWAKAGAEDFYSAGKSVHTDNIGNVYVTGYFTKGITFDSIKLPSYGKRDMFVVKYDSNGKVLWAKSGRGDVMEYGNSITTDSDGNVYVAGGFTSSYSNFDGISLVNAGSIDWGSGGTPDLYLAKYNSEGQIQWVRFTGREETLEVINDISTDSKGNIYVTGFFSDVIIQFDIITLHSYDKINGNNADMFIAKYDTYGRAIWAKSIGGSDTDRGYGIISDDKGNIYISGFSSSPSMVIDSLILDNPGWFISKYDTNGNRAWTIPVGGEDGFSEVGRNIGIDNNSNITISGYFIEPSMQVGSIVLEKMQENVRNMFVAKLKTIPTSVNEDNRTYNINIFPNPTSSHFHITNLEPGNWTITIYTLDGQSVFKKELTESNAMIDLSGKAKGAYVYRLLKDGEVFKTGKLMLE